MKKLITILLFGALTGCASIIRDNNQTVQIKSNVDKVDIEIKDKNGFVIFNGQTPAIVNLKSSKGGYFNPEEYTIKASKDGYINQTAIIDSHVSNWYIFGNLGFGGLIGYLIVDPITGDMYYLDEEKFLNMTPIK
ncbi:MAG: hypothetical protein R3Y43_01165 [Alphaproteobacteria bacterium]